MTRTRVVPTPTCPHCGCGHVQKHGFFSHQDGSRLQRYRCCGCRRTFNPATGTLSANLKKRAEWVQMAAQMAETNALRRIAFLLRVHLSTAFRWRHRWLAARCRDQQKTIAGPVAVTTAMIRYSEKGSRTCRGPGSWGYWDWLRRGPRPDGYLVQHSSRAHFRRFIHGRPSCVLLAQNGMQHAARILGQCRPTLDALKDGLQQLIAEAEVYGFCSGPLAEACERLNLMYQDGWQAARHRPPDPHCTGKGPRRPPFREPERPHLWLRQFRGVATRYLHHYMNWFSFQLNQEAAG